VRLLFVRSRRVRPANKASRSRGGANTGASVHRFENHAHAGVQGSGDSAKHGEGMQAVAPLRFLHNAGILRCWDIGTTMKTIWIMKRQAVLALLLASAGGACADADQKTVTPVCLTACPQANDQLLYFTSTSLLADDQHLVFLSDRTGSRISSCAIWPPARTGN